MKSTKMLTILALGLMTCLVGFTEAAPMGTAWTYQGRLMDANSVADSLYDFQFKLFDANVAGTQQGSTIEVNDLDVISGYFTVEVDFGSTVFSGDARWLEIDVRPGDSTGSFTTLSPRQEVTPVPYALQTRGIFVDSTGNVGIGTYTPEKKLHVLGGIKISDTDAAIYFDETSGGASDNWLAGAFEGDFRIGQRNTTAGNRFLIQNGGNVGIGTTAPSSKLHIESNTTSEVSMKIHNLNNAGSERLYFGSNTSDAGMIVWGSNNATYPGKWRFFNNKTSSHFDWITGASIRMTLDNNGNLGIGTETPTAKLDVRSSSELKSAQIINSSSSGVAYGVNVLANGAGGTSHYAGRFSASGATNNYAIYADGVGSKSYFSGNVGIGTTSPSYKLHVVGSAAKTTGIYWTSISDRRLKKNIKPLEGSLDRLTRLQGRTFTWKDAGDLNAREGTHIGLVAQEVEEVFPQWVSEDNQGRKQVTLEGLEAVTIEAIKELKIENELLRERLEILEERLNGHQFAINKEVQ